MACDKTILIVGGSGVFGSRLAAGLVQDGFTDVVIAGRDLRRAKAKAEPLGARAFALDIHASDLAARLADLAPWLVIDAAGPFQAYGAYPLAEAAIVAGAHYFDLSDDGPFTAGIAAALDAKAKKAGVVVRSGVSTVPALSSPVVRELSKGLSDIALIETIILPGNRAPRGLSVMKAILAQIGKQMVNGDFGWVSVRRVEVDGLNRLASPIGAPDLHLMPEAFGAKEVRFLASLELPVMHRGLELLARLVRAGVIKNAVRFARPLRLGAAALYYFGTDKGGMRLRVVGHDASGALKNCQWSLIAIGGDGPHIPALPGRVLAAMLRDDRLQPGARAEMHDLVLNEVEAHAPPLRLSFSRSEESFVPQFQKCLGPQFDALPDQIKELHHVVGRKVWTGEASVTRGKGPAARFIAGLFRFPKASRSVPVRVTMDRTDTSEVWLRRFGTQDFHSELTPDARIPGRMWERFGLFTFAIDFEADETGLAYPVAQGRVLGLPIPRPLLPKSDTLEAVDTQGHATFSVRLSMPLVGLIVHYEGWLTPDA
ncbi:MAG: DUF4166 domain-containing protein [Silicimonas sp.]|nr:DUF4166 domain-containing protein [Silicimonas sp.]